MTTEWSHGPLMLHCLRSRVDPPSPLGFGAINPPMPFGFGATSEEVGPHAWLVAPDQFANYVCFRLALLRQRRDGVIAPYRATLPCDADRRRDGVIALPYGQTASPTEDADMVP